MNKRNIPRFVLISFIIGYLGLGSALAVDEVKLRSAIDDDSLPAIQLKGGVKIDRLNQTISLSLRDSDVRQVLRMLADKAGLNIVLDDKVMGKVTVDLVNISVNKAFDYIMTLNQLTYWQDENTIIIANKADAARLSLNKSQVKPIKIKYLEAGVVAKFLNNNIFSLNKPDTSSNPIVTTNPTSNEILIFGNDNDVALAQKVISYLDNKPKVKTYTVNYMDADNMASVICDTVFKTSGSTGGASSGVGTGSGSGETKTNLTCGNINLVNGTNLESLAASNFAVLTDKSLGRITLYGGTDEQAGIISDLIKKLDKKQPQVYVEISIIELSDEGNKTLTSTLYAHSGSFNLSSNGGIATGSFGSQSSVNTVVNSLSQYSNQQFLATTIQALIKHNMGKILANPRIIATNNLESKINITSDYVKTTAENIVTTTSSAVTTYTPTIDQMGIQLALTPKITPDGYVFLDLAPSYTTQNSQMIDPTNSNVVLATLLNRRDLTLKNVRVKDGQTLVFGGLIQEAGQSSTNKIPILGDIPILGNFFKGISNDRKKSELILMITPKIIHDGDEVEAI